ncbi:MAG: ECF-type sigma factor [Planctomycetota bacterium]
MADAACYEITRLLRSWREGEPRALDELMPLVYDRLRRLAALQLKNEPNHTLPNTALVHELFLELAGTEGIQLKDRSHFYALAARLMRRILIHHARARAALKRGGDRQRNHVDLDSLTPAPETWDLLALDDALRDLKELAPQRHEVVELRFFGGLTFDEIANVLDQPKSNIWRDFQVARAWLYRYIREGIDR